MTDNEIIKALECCIINTNCNGCPHYKNDKIKSVECLEITCKQALDLINRLQAQNEVYETCNARKNETIKSLESRLKRMQMQFDDIGKMYSEIKAEAYKEFAEGLIEKIEEIPQFRFSLLNIENTIDNLSKELVGETDG